MTDTRQMDLLDWKPPIYSGDHDGVTFERDKDRKRLNRQLQLVYDLMKDGQWRTLGEIADATNAPEASVSARLRDLRKEKVMGATVERERVSKGLFRYRLILQGE